jgi:hypothetical protein
LSWSTVDTTLGVFGQSLSTDGRGVYGYATATSGITSGVYGVSESPAGNGVYGEATATTGPAFGVWGKTMSTSPGAYGVYYTGGLGGTGPMTGTVKTSRGPTVLYCQESSECWFEEFGEGTLATGRAYIELDPLFLETVTIDENNPMKVFVQLHDETCQGVAVKKGPIGFDVIELRGGRSNSTFDFRVVAKRRGFEAKRLEISEAARTDPYLYPEQRERDLTAIERRRLLLKRKLEERAQSKTITADGTLVSVHDYVDAVHD